jgi:rRNA-processing protein FCF1
LATHRNGNTDRVRVLLDTNALLLPVQFRIDIFEEIGGIVGDYEPILLEGVRSELAGIARGRGKDAVAAQVGLSLCDRCTTVTQQTPQATVDEQILDYAKKTGCIVVTNDRMLRDALFKEGIDVIAMRKRKKLELLRA